MADYWAKVYIEIIDDPKMATLPDRLWRRIIELFLLAKKINNGGHLPDTKQIAWMLRMSTDDLDLDMKQISSTKIVIQTETGWFIPNFEKRQAAATNTERVNQFRKRQQKEQYYDNVTEMKRIVTQRTETETETEAETEAKSAAAVYSAYQNNIGLLTGVISEKIDADIKEYTAQWVIEAIEKATIQEKRSLGYVEGILKGWKRDGKGTSKPEENKYQSAKVYDE